MKTRRTRSLVLLVAGLGLAAALARPIADTRNGELVLAMAVVVLSSLVGSAVAVLVFKRDSPFLAAYCLVGGLYFSTAWTLLAGPLEYLGPYLLPSAWTALSVYYPADRYWPDQPLIEKLDFAMVEDAGPFVAAHVYWTGVLGIAAGFVATRWRVGVATASDKH